MFQTMFFTVLGAIVATAGSIVLISLFKNLLPEVQLATAAFLGAICSSIFVCREKYIQKKIGKDAQGKKKGLVAKLKTALFWLILVSGLAAVAIVGLKMFGRS
jgi:hypothetical protein